MRNIVYFDLETQNAATDVGGWRNVAKLRMSVGVTFSTALNRYKIYTEHTVGDLINQLLKADLVVGFNVLKFDYEVLHAYTALDLHQIPTLDIMVDLANKLQRRLSLDALAKATLNLEKTSDGMQAIRWFKEGKLLEIAEYCCYDVKLTMLLHQFGIKHGFIYYTDQQGRKRKVEVDWCPRQDSNLYGVTH